MNKEQYDKLIKYEQIFRTAIDSKYYRTMDKVFAADFIAMCRELNVYIKPSCPQCVLKALQTIGKLYFEYKEPVEEKPIQDTPKPIDNKTITKTNKVPQKSQKQSKKKK